MPSPGSIIANTLKQYALQGPKLFVCVTVEPLAVDAAQRACLQDLHALSVNVWPLDTFARLRQRRRARTVPPTFYSRGRHLQPRGRDEV